MSKILDQKILQCFPMGRRSRHSIRFQFKSWLNILCWFICVLYLKWTPIWWLVVMVYSYYRNQTGILHYHYMDQIMVKFELDCRIWKNHSIKFGCVCATDFFIFIFQNCSGKIEPEFRSSEMYSKHWQRLRGKRKLKCVCGQCITNGTYKHYVE